jgi:hypothetical protein
MGFIEDIRKNYEKYNELIAMRLDDMEKPLEQRSMSVKKFVREETKLNRIGTRLRRAMKMYRGESVLCEQCKGVFSAKGIKTKRSFIEKCDEHKGRNGEYRGDK